MCVVINNPKVQGRTVSNKAFLGQFGTKLDKAPKSLSEVPADKTAVMDMTTYKDIHVAQEPFELNHLRGYEGTWYLIDKSVLKNFL